MTKLNRTQQAVAEANRIERQMREEARRDTEQAAAERAIGRPPFPTKRRQPKITRHMSRQQRIATGQSPNTIRSIYVPESKWNATPVINPEEHELTREVGPGDDFNRTYRTGKSTRTATGEGNKRQYPNRRAAGGGNNRRTKAQWDEFADDVLKRLGL